MKILLILAVLIQLTYAVEFFKSGEISSSTPTELIDNEELTILNQYVNPFTTSFTFETTFSMKDMSVFSIAFMNEENDALELEIWTSLIEISTLGLYTKGKYLNNNLSEDLTYKLILNYSSEDDAGVIRVRVFDPNQSKIFDSGEFVSIHSFFNSIVFNYNSYGSGSYSSCGSNCPPPKKLTIESYKFTVTPATTKRNVVVVPMF